MLLNYKVLGTFMRKCVFLISNWTTIYPEFLEIKGGDLRALRKFVNMFLATLPDAHELESRIKNTFFFLSESLKFDANVFHVLSVI